jgi:hypothetical protein
MAASASAATDLSERPAGGYGGKNDELEAVHRGLLRIVQGGMDYTPPCHIPSCHALMESLREQEASRLARSNSPCLQPPPGQARFSARRGTKFNCAQFTGAAPRWKSGAS